MKKNKFKDEITDEVLDEILKATDPKFKQRRRYQVGLKLDPETDKDIIDVLKSVDKKQTFIKSLIREHIEMYS